jgi:hypothetical protein
MNDLERMVLEQIGESTTSPDVFADTETGMAQIRDSLNDAIEELAMVTGSNKREYPLALKEDSAFYRLHFNQDELAWITDAWLVGQSRRLEHTDVIRLNSHNPRWMEQTGTTEAYYPIGISALGVWPRPTADGDIIVLTCVVIPSRYTNEDDRIKLRDKYQWAAVDYAVGEYYASRGDAKTALYHHGEYIKKLGVQSLYPKAAERRWYYKTDKQATG